MNELKRWMVMGAAVGLALSAGGCDPKRKSGTDVVQGKLDPEPEKLPCRTCAIEVHTPGADFLSGRFEAGEAGVPKYPVKSPTLLVGTRRIPVTSGSIQENVDFHLALPASEDPATWTDKVHLEVIDANDKTCVQENLPVQS